jgi:phosphorylase kinase alpha/beta subunit
MHIDFDAEITHHLNIIRTMQTPTGVFTASGEDTFYNKAWLRDIYFIVLSFLEVGEIETVKKAAKALLTVLVKHEGKISWAIENKPQETWQYIHARFHPETFEEYWEEWGNSQNDAVGEVLNLLVELELRGEGVIETDQERAVVQKLVDYLVAIEYWHDDDNGIWEENLEVHASSIGSVVAALKKAQQLEWLHVSNDAIHLGQEALNHLLPRESVTKFVDLALMTLIYPFAVTTEEQTQEILRNVEYHLVRDKGVLRYVFDRYYNLNDDGYSQEAEWCFGLAWLAIIYAERGDRERAEYYLERSRATVTPDGLIPEAYFSQTNTPNPNTPLAWAESMHVIALHKVRNLP